MKKLLFTITLLGFFGIASAQDATTNTELTIRITISEADAVKAKSLKSIETGKLIKGESRTEYLISTSSKELPQLKEELIALFPGCKTEVISGK